MSSIFPGAMLRFLMIVLLQTDWVKVLRPTRHKTGHFRDFFLGLLPTTQMQTAREQKVKKNTQKQTYRKLKPTVIYNTAQISSDSLPSYPADNHHSSDVVNWRGGNDNVVATLLPHVMYLDAAYCYTWSSVSVRRTVCLSQSWAYLQKLLSRSRCCLGYELGWVQGSKVK